MREEAMRDPVRRTAWRRGAALLFALALAACGGDAPAEEGAAEGAEDAAVRTAADGGAAAPCAPPPAAGFQPVSGLPWSTVQAYLGGVSFAEDSADTGNVKVCEECNAFRARVVSEKRSYCLKESDLQGSLRLVGMMVALEPPVGKQPSGFGPQNKGDALYLFARGTQAYVMYQARSLPNQPAGDTSVVVPAWSFHFCADGGHGNRSKAAARWIPDTVTEVTGNAAQVRGKDDDVVGGGGGQLSYGWMACANGCCQFYGPPPQQDVEMVDPQPSKGNDPPVRPARRAADCPV